MGLLPEPCVWPTLSIDLDQAKHRHFDVTNRRGLLL